MADELFGDFAEERDQMLEVFKYLQLKDSASRHYTADDALNLANMSRLYVDPSPDVAAAVAASGISWDDPLLGDINFEDKAEQEKGFWDKVGGAVTGAVRGTARGVGSVVEAVWEEGFSRPVRTGIKAYQDDTDQSIVESWREAGGSDLAIAAGELSEGRDVNWGTGYIPSSELAHEQPGFGKDLTQGIASRTAQGMDPMAAREESQTELTESFYEEAGAPVTYFGQQARESTIITKTRDGVDYRTPYSPGRAAAIQITDPQSQLFNVISGSIDATLRIGWDPLNLPADELGKAFKARNLIIPDGAKEAGLVSGKRPWVNPKTATQWLQTGRGKRLTEWISKTDSIDELNQLVGGPGGLPMSAQRKLRLANTPEAVENILRPYMGTVLEEAPTLGAKRVLGDKVFGNPDANTFMGPDSRIGKWGRRWGAESGDRMVSAYEIEGTMGTFRNQLDTLGASADDTESVLLKVALAENNPKKLHAAYGEYMDVVGKRLNELGYDAEQATIIMSDLLDEQAQAQIYLHDIAKNPITVEGADYYTVKLPDGTDYEFPISGAHLDSEFAEHTLVMPNIADVRRLSSETRAARALGMTEAKGPLTATAGAIGEIDKTVRTRMGWDAAKLKGAQRGAVTQQLDKYQSIWRDFALARGGWTMRVIAEEAIRRRGAGYSKMVDMDPAQIFMRQLDPSTRLTDVKGNLLDEFFKEKGLGASGFNRTIDNEIVGTRFDRSRQNWEPVATMSVDGNGVATWTDKGRKGLANEYLQLWGSEAGRVVARVGVDEASKFFKTQEGIELLADIGKRSGGGITSKLDDPKYLERWLESIDARIAEMTGGDFVYRNEGQTEWLTSKGDKWEDNPYAWTGDQVDDQLAAMEIKGPRGGKPRGSVEERRALLLDEMGLPSSKDFGDRQFVTIRSGKDDLRMKIAGEDGTFHPDMTPEEFVAFEDSIPGLFDDDYLPPAHVKSASPELDRRLGGAYKTFMNGVFSTIMEKPTMALNRSPFARTIYTEEMARFSMWADGPTRTKLTKWAKDNNILDDYRRLQKEQMKALNIKKLPKVENPFTSFDDMDRLAKAKAINDSKALFYDLAQKGNWADASRFIAPFADAWWEVISRWAQMLTPSNSMGGVGQSFRNWERIRQGAQEITNQVNQPGNKGWFGEDQFGNRVFNFPGAGLLTPGVRDNFKSTIQLQSLMFVDPTSPRGLGLPGAGPYMQFPAQLVTPTVRKFFGQNAAGEINEFIFGDFAPEELTGTEQFIEPFLPTWGRRFFDAVLNDRYARQFADEIIGTYSALLINEDDRYNDKNDVQSKLTLEQARDTGQQLAYSRILDSLLSPASQQYEAGVLIEMENMENGNLWLSMSAIGNELKNAEKLFGDDIIARQYVMEKFGFDPLKVLKNKSRMAYARPIGEEAFNKLKDNPQLEKNFNYTLMAFLPEGANPEFYGPAWTDQFKGEDPAREKIMPDSGRQIISRQQGNMAYEQLNVVYDEALEQAKQIYEDKPKSLKQYRDALNQWKYQSQMDISAQHFAWGSDKTITGVNDRPTYENLYDEIMNVTELNSEPRSVAEDMNPELVTFLDRVADLEAQLEAASLADGKTYDWWRSKGGGLESQEEKRRIHEWYIANMEGAISQMDNDQSVASARWMQERIFVPRIGGVEFEDEVVFMPIEPPVPSRDYLLDDQQERKLTTQDHAANRRDR